MIYYNMKIYDGNNIHVKNFEKIDINAESVYIEHVKNIPNLNIFEKAEDIYIINNDLKKLPLLPKILRHLNCSENNLLEIKDLPENIIEITCSKNKLEKLDLPESIVTIDFSDNNLSKFHLSNNINLLQCQRNNLSELILSESIESLDCSTNYLKNLNLVESLIYLDCSNNFIENLNLVESLKTLHCSNNLIENLGILPINLEYLDCSNNIIKNLGILPKKLKILNCLNNELKFLNKLPEFLEELNCSINKLKKLNLVESLIYLDCSNNFIENLGILPKKLKILNCSINELKFLNKLPEFLEELNCSNNKLTYLPKIPLFLKINYLHNLSLNPYIFDGYILNGKRYGFNAEDDTLWFNDHLMKYSKADIYKKLGKKLQFYDKPRIIKSNKNKIKKEDIVFDKECPEQLIPKEGKCPPKFPFIKNNCCYKNTAISMAFTQKKYYKCDDVIFTDKYDINQIIAIKLWSHNGDVALAHYTTNNFIVNEELSLYICTHIESFHNIIQFSKKVKYEDKNFYLLIINNDDIIYVCNIIMYIFYGILLECFYPCTDHLILYRGISFKVNYKANTFIKFNTFIAASCSRRVAKDFIGEEGTFFTIYVPQGSKLCTVLDYSRYKDEKEILLEHNSEFYILSVEEINNIINVRMVLVFSESGKKYINDIMI